jgi:hypothetical protein
MGIEQPPVLSEGKEREEQEKNVSYPPVGDGSVFAFEGFGKNIPEWMKEANDRVDQDIEAYKQRKEATKRWDPVLDAIHEKLERCKQILHTSENVVDRRNAQEMYEEILGGYYTGYLSGQEAEKVRTRKEKPPEFREDVIFKVEK